MLMCKNGRRVIEYHIDEFTVSASNARYVKMGVNNCVRGGQLVEGC